MSMLMRAENFSSRMEGQWCARKIFWRGHVDAHARRKFLAHMIALRCAPAHVERAYWPTVRANDLSWSKEREKRWKRVRMLPVQNQNLFTFVPFMPKYFTRASLPFHTRRKIFGAHEHRHDCAKIFYARIFALPYETKIFRLVWKGNDARVKYLGAVLSM